MTRPILVDPGIAKERYVLTESHIRVTHQTGGEKLIHTDGMEKFGLLNLIIEGVPLFLSYPAMVLLNSVANYMVAAATGVAGPGLTVQQGTEIVFAGSTIVMHKAIIQAGTEFKEAWVLRDTPMEGRCDNPDCPNHGEAAHRHKN